MLRSLLMVTGCTLFCFGCGSSQSVEVATPKVDNNGAMMMNTPFYARGIDSPIALSVRDAEVDDDVEVIGVVVKGHSRAYVLKQMSPVFQHVVNDRFAGTSITVTYCDRKECIRVLTDPNADKPLAIDLGGYTDGMFIRFGTRNYMQETGKGLTDANDQIPLELVPHMRMLWKDWLASHPDTDVVPKLKPAHLKTEMPAIAFPMQKDKL